MKIVKNPPRLSWSELIKRPSLELEFLEGTVKNIINRVKTSGDAALKEMSVQFDKVSLQEFLVSPTELAIGGQQVSSSLKDAIRVAIKNITKFHKAQSHDTLKLETMPGVNCWRKAVAIERVGIYVPGGTAPLFSTLLMLGIPARLAGCEEIVVCTPPRQDGSLDPSILFAAQEIGIENIYKVGGAQAIAAMAFGTKTIPSVYKIYGPGNQYVTKAKQMVNAEGIAIDLPAGPSEVMVVADDSSNPSFIAADLLSQAEHGGDSQVMLVTSSEELIVKVEEELAKQIETLPRKLLAAAALEQSRSILLSDLNDQVDFINHYAPEHLILQTERAMELSEKIKNAGSVFVGPYSPESIGDYASGTNHTLPTNGFAKAYSGVSLESFQKLITFQQLSREGLALLGPTVEQLAEAEQLRAHKLAVTIRLQEDV
ncbi:MAG: histidinol dehydrogenase [Cyclobacteriaceae bacterium]